MSLVACLPACLPACILSSHHWRHKEEEFSDGASLGDPALQQVFQPVSSCSLAVAAPCPANEWCHKSSLQIIKEGCMLSYPPGSVVSELWDITQLNVTGELLD